MTSRFGTSAVSPLQDLKVLCFAELYPGPYAASLLVDLGAKVIQIERPGGDRARPVKDFFAAFARGKRSVCIDLKEPQSRQRLMPLLEQADVLIEGASPGAMERVGFDYASMRAINPRLIYASITGFGQSGPYRDRTGHDLSYQAAAGLLTDPVAGESIKPGLAAGDASSALFAVIGILAALQGRALTGQGSFIDVSMMDCLTSCMAPWITPHLNGRRASDMGDAPAYALFATSDGKMLSLSILIEDHFWRDLCALLDLPQYGGLDLAARTAQGLFLRGELAARIARQPLRHWTEVFDRKRIAWSPVQSFDEVAHDPHLNARGLFDTVPDGRGGTLRIVRQPLKFSAYQNAPLTGVPALGEANEELLT